MPPLTHDSIASPPRRAGRRPGPALTLGLMLGLALCPNASRASMLEPHRAADLVDRAEIVFTGTVVAKEVATTADGSFPFTFVTFQLEEVFKGSAEDRLTLRMAGGVLGEMETLIAGSPRFESGGRYLVFAEGNGTRMVPVVGWEQGALELLPHPLSGEDVLVDLQGAPVLAARDGSWTKSSLRLDRKDGRIHADSVRRRIAPGVEILAEDGLTITPAGASSSRARDTAGIDTLLRQLRPAGAVLAELRRLVSSRSGSEGFRPGLRVESARVADVPEALEW